MVPALSQSLEGDWKGKYESSQIVQFAPTIPGITPNSVSISLKFILNKDSSYSVFSFTKGLNLTIPDTTVVCRVIGQFRNDSLYLEEVQMLLPIGVPPSCFQKMFLKINKKKKLTELRGTWGAISANCNSSGTVYFWKKKE